MATDLTSNPGVLGSKKYLSEKIHPTKTWTKGESKIAPGARNIVAKMFNLKSILVFLYEMIISLIYPARFSSSLKSKLKF